MRYPSVRVIASAAGADGTSEHAFVETRPAGDANG